MHVLVHVKAATLMYVTCGVGRLGTNRVTEHLFLAQTSLPLKAPAQKDATLLVC